VFICVPLMPGVRSVPRLIPVHRLIWRQPRPPLGPTSDAAIEATQREKFQSVE
jgi:hypothetical protein